jgi:hypothetical protein
MTPRRSNLSGAFGRIDLIFCIVAVIVLIGLFLPVLPNERPRASRITCLNNLKQVGIGFRLYASDGTLYPPYKLTNQAWQYFQIAEKYIGSPKFLICPDDPSSMKLESIALDFDGTTNSLSDRRFQNKSLSYFYGAGTAPADLSMLLAGDHHLTSSGQFTHGTLIVKSNSLIAWTKDIHKGEGNVALADGSAQQLSTSKLRQQLASVTNETQTLVLP